jgi:glycosyltransferase involved in cell wall biosynthesis
MPYRLLYLIGELRAGGSERQLYYLLKQLDGKFYQPAVAVWTFRETDAYVAKIRALGIPIHSLSRDASRVTKLRELCRIVRRIRPDVVHSYSSYTNFAAHIAAMSAGSLAIGGIRSDFLWAKKESGAIVGRLSARWPRRQIVNSFATAETAAHSRSMFAPKTCMVVRNGIDLDAFQHVRPASGQVAHIVGIGSLFPVKRWDRLIVAAAQLQQRALRFRMTVLGDGPLREELTERAQLLGVGELVQFVGHRADIPAALSEASFLIHTADSEGCPNVIMEAMAGARAVVATDVGDVSRLVDDGTTGFIVPRENMTLLVDRLAALIHDSQLCSRMGAAGREKAEREFTLAKMVSETLAAYRAVGWSGTEGVGQCYKIQTTE